MVSQIDASKPATGIDQPVKVIRDNFAYAKIEIEDMQTNKVSRLGDTMAGILRLYETNVANLPLASANRGGVAFLGDLNIPVFCDGTNWRRFTDNSIVA